jgi:hypothetical protein
MADALDSGSSGGNIVGVQVPSSAPYKNQAGSSLILLFGCLIHLVIECIKKDVTELGEN